MILFLCTPLEGRKATYSGYRFHGASFVRSEGIASCEMDLSENMSLCSMASRQNRTHEDLLGKDNPVQDNP